jgi:hypothetical protein
MSSFAPIALFVYNRPWHVRQTLESLQANSLSEQTDLFIFSDGAKNDKDLEPVNEVRRYIHGIGSFRRVEIMESPTNKGLSTSIISGTTSVIAQYGRIIVLEDDLITSPHFLRFMNEGLQCYESEDEVISVHGYVYPTKQILPETFFLRGADCWGWATWKRGWDLFDQDGAKLLSRLAEQKLFKRFDMDGTFPYTQMLEDQVAGKNDSWAIRWHASAFLADKLTFYPGKSLVRNIGIDSSGIHCSTSYCYDGLLSNKPISLKGMEIIESKIAFQAFRHFLQMASNKNFKRKVARILQSITRKVHLEKH